MSDAPTFSVTTERIYDKLPDIYREVDATVDYAFKKYISSVTDVLGDVDLLVERFRYRSQIELEFRKRYAQRFTTYTHPGRVNNAPPLGSTSDLVDPRSADASWLPWLGQLVGVQVDVNAPIIDTRDSIFFASSGYRAGSKDALEKAARSVLSGSRYAVALPHTKVVTGQLVAGNVWDLTILTRDDESPSSFILLQAVNKPTLKPAGVILYHRTYTASWDALEAALPYWSDWETTTWAAIELAGMTYTGIQGNVVPNPSFESDIVGWTATGPITLTRVGGGVDGNGYLRGDMSGPGTKAITSPVFTMTANEAWVYGITYQCQVASRLELIRDGSVVVSTPLNVTSPGEWNRINTGVIPIDAGNYQLRIASDEGDVNTSIYLDGALVRHAGAAPPPPEDDDSIPGADLFPGSDTYPA